MENNKIHLQIGKNGVTPGLIVELNNKLMQTDPVVIKLLKSFRENNDRKVAAQELADKTNSRIQKIVGGTVTLTRKHKKNATQKTGTQ